MKSFAINLRPHALAVAIAGVVLVGRPAAAFKLDTHVWIAQEVLNDLLPDGKLTIAPFGEFTVKPEIVRALRDHAKAYRMGHIGPDGFPDVIAGQMTAHPGVPGGWQTDDWLRWVLGEARTSAELAFAYGYLGHAAADVWAHTYVNTYAGDILVLTDGEAEVEARHMALEDYILHRQPPLRDGSGRALSAAESVEVPVAFARDALILASGAAREYRRQGSTAYLAKMRDFLERLDEAVALLEETEATINEEIEKVQDEIQDLQDKIDDLTKRTVKICIPFTNKCKRVRIFPASCFLLPPVCASILVFRGALEVTEHLIEVPKALVTVLFTSGLNPLVHWRDNVRQAIGEYIRMSEEVAKEILEGPDGDPMRPVRNWLCQWLPTFFAIPAEAVFPICGTLRAVDAIRDFHEGIQRAEDRIAEKLGVFTWLVAPHIKIRQAKDKVVEDLKHEFAELAADLAGALAGDDSLLVDLIVMRTPARNTAEATEKLRSIFAQDGSSKGLLEIGDVVDRVNADMRLGGSGKWSPSLFPPISNAIVLAKISLLDAPELNRMARDAGVACTIYGGQLFKPAQPFNALFGGLRSIDGHHQWQETALQLPRRGGFADSAWPAGRHYGIDFIQNVGMGFPLWHDEDARLNLFFRIFKGPLAAAIEDPESVGLSALISDDHPLRATETDPFPLSAGSDLPPDNCRARPPIDFLRTPPFLKPEDHLHRIDGGRCGFGLSRFASSSWAFVEECTVTCFRVGTLPWSCEGPACASGSPALETFTVSVVEDLDAEVSKRGKILEKTITNGFDPRGRPTSQAVYRIDVRQAGTPAGGGVSVEWNGNLICDPAAPSTNLVIVQREDLRLVFRSSYFNKLLQRTETCEREMVFAGMTGLFGYASWSKVEAALLLKGESACSFAAPPAVEVVEVPPDTAPPVLAAPPDLPLGCPGPADPGEARASDDRDPEVQVTHDAPASFPFGTTLVTWRAVDDAGNETQAEQRVTVADTVPPSFLDQPQEVNVMAIDPEGTPVRLSAPRAADDCTGPVTVVQEEAESLFPAGTSTVVWIARDGAGNEARVTQTVTVEVLKGDIDVDGDVDLNDLNIVLQSVGSGALNADSPIQDFDENGTIDAVDEETHRLIASAGLDPRDLDLDLRITAEDARLLIALCTRPLCGAAHAPFRRGDINADGGADLSDAVAILTDLFLGGRTGEACPKASDSDDNGALEVTDAIFVLAYLLTGGRAPAEPWGGCGFDATIDSLGCGDHAACR